ncbi:hypothetical protein ACINWC743_3037 [Acinetobacter sp. WC-743]|nr:hypothetical protein ACINWC743_3037 [Acinetobacter sp. WC-743]
MANTGVIAKTELNMMILINRNTSLDSYFYHPVLALKR